MIEECDERPKNDAALLGSPTTEAKPLTVYILFFFILLFFFDEKYNLINY